MSYQPLPYSDADSAATMSADCTACAHEMRIPRTRALRPEVMGQVPSIAYDAYPREIRKSRITVSDAAARLANTLHLHMD